ncbi:MAG: nitroreductase family protein [Deltaproteobacteria bacterium]|nr:nitroreductase family protein [Deltaproteobacteria bacterium]
MDFETLLINRRSVRNYRDKEVPLPLIETILEDTCLAPTAGNRQPCRFVVIRDRALIKRLSDDSKRSLRDDLTRTPDIPAKRHEERLNNEAFNVFYNAPCLIYIIGPDDLPSLNVDCGLTAAYLMFSATARGLATCWIGLGAYVRDRRLLDEIGVPEGQRIVAPIILGYPEAIPTAAERHPPAIVKAL